MTPQKTTPKRTKVRAENPSGACGKIEHMTIDELKEIAVGDSFDGKCPACGMFHLRKEDIEALESEKISHSDYYSEMKMQAEEDWTSEDIEALESQKISESVDFVAMKIEAEEGEDL